MCQLIKAASFQVTNGSKAFITLNKNVPCLTSDLTGLLFVELTILLAQFNNPFINFEWRFVAIVESGGKFSAIERPLLPGAKSKWKDGERVVPK